MSWSAAPQSFVLSDLSCNVTMGVSGELISEVIPVLTSDATAIFYVSVEEMKAVFKFQTDASNIDLSAGIPDSGLKFFVVDSAFQEHNPADASLNDSKSVGAMLSANGAGVELSTAQSTVACDYVRYLAYKLFNTAYAEELFSNGFELTTNIHDICHTMWTTDITATLAAVGVTNATLHGPDPTTGYYYSDESNLTSSNLCRELLAQLAKTDPSRFNAAHGLIADTTELQSIPFVAGDSISYLLKINPAAGQEGLTGVAPFDGRTYQIRMFMQ